MLIETKTVSIWVVTSYQKIEESDQSIKDECILDLAYNEDCVMLASDITDEFVKRGYLMYLEDLKLVSIFNRPYCGGVFL